MNDRTNQSRRSFLRGAAAAAGIFAYPALASGALSAAESRIGPARVQDGFRPLFDGKTLNGWKPQPRDLKQPSLGLWAVQDGVLIGGQERPKVGNYLTSEETFADFELELEARPDWPADTGVMVRANAQGNVGFQMCLDHRPHGAIGGYFGNGLGNFHATNYCFTGRKDASGRLVQLVAEKPSEPLDATNNVRLDYALPAERFLRIWKVNGWNRFRLRSVGAVPHLTTWINGVKVAELDTAKMKGPTGWAPAKVDGLVGRAGHIAFEVHSNGGTDWLGNERWAPGAVCRWRNILIKAF